MGNLQQVDTHELGEAIDMIKDLEEAMYYCSIVKAMEDSEKEKESYSWRGYTDKDYFYPDPRYRDLDRNWGRMYYSDRWPRNENGEFMGRGRGDNSSSMGGRGSNSSGQSGNSGSSTSYYTEREIQMPMHDVREGKSPMTRRMYMESKEMHKDKESKMKELEQYMKELSEDITEMIDDASPEEKEILSQKLTTLAAKIK